MTIRRRFTTLLILGTVAFGGTALAVAGAAQATGSCGQSSAQSTYGGQGQQIVKAGCGASSGSALPFTGLDLGLIVAAGGLLVAAGVAVRWWLRHGGA
jgi:hypothetical protein